MVNFTVSTDLLNYCTGIRRHLHSNPELSFKELQTSDYIISKLKEIGLEGYRVAGTGVYTIIDSGKPGAVVAFRADIDALPIHEENDVPYASKLPGVMHACGHDGHTAILLGLACMLQRYKNDLIGKIILIFQPGEEHLSGGGALSIIDSGILKGVDMMLGLHINTMLPLGTASVRTGPVLAAYDSFIVEITGLAGHGGLPHTCIDPIVVGSQLVNAWQTIVSRKVNPLCPAVLTVGTFNSGDNFNVISGKAALSGTIRTLSEETRSAMEACFFQMTEQICCSYGAKVNIRYEKGCPVLISDEKPASMIRDAAIACLGSEKVLQLDPLMASDDFALYRRVCPTAYFILGAGNHQKGYNYSVHHSRFDFDEEVLPIGVQIYLRTLAGLWTKYENSI